MSSYKSDEPQQRDEEADKVIRGIDEELDIAAEEETQTDYSRVSLIDFLSDNTQEMGIMYILFMLLTSNYVCSLLEANVPMLADNEFYTHLACGLVLVLVFKIVQYYKR